MSSPRIIVFGYHDVGYACLEALITRGENVAAVFTHVDDPGEQIWFHSVAELAQRHGIPVHFPANVNAPEWVAHIRELRPDLILSFYYRNLLSGAILSLAPLGAYNLHGSLLPKYRGRAPVNWAIVQGEAHTGVTLHQMIARADAGDMVDQQTVSIEPEETAREVFAKIAAAAREVLERRIDDLKTGSVLRIPQDESRATYCRGRVPEDGRIDWQDSARSIFNLVRAVTHPYPGAFTEFEGKRLWIWWARPRAGRGGRPGTVLMVAPLLLATGDGSLEVLRLQWEGEAERDAAEGDHRLRVGLSLGAEITV